MFLHVCLSHRSELVSERERTAELQDKLSSCVQEKLTAERKIEALEVEKQTLNEHLKRYQEQKSVKDDLFSCQEPAQPHMFSIGSGEDMSLYSGQVNETTRHL